jgi:hypothetical protein
MNNLCQQLYLSSKRHYEEQLAERARTLSRMQKTYPIGYRINQQNF